MLEKIINFIFPLLCASCGGYLNPDAGPGIRLCGDCREKFTYIKPLFCRKCGLPLESGGEHCFSCLAQARHPQGKIYYEYLRGVCEFEGISKDLIHSFKYRGKQYLGKTLGMMLASYMQTEDELRSADIITPVPLHWYKKFRRGYNQSELLAKEVSSFYLKPLVTDGIYRKKHTRPQVALKRPERIRNLSGAFALKKPEQFSGKKILLIDDVSTTGETINQCAKLLKEAGALRVYGLAFARDV